MKKFCKVVETETTQVLCVKGVNNHVQPMIEITFMDEADTAHKARPAFEDEKSRDSYFDNINPESCNNLINNFKKHNL